MGFVRIFNQLPVFNTVTPSSAGAAGAPTFANPPSGSIVEAQFASSGASEIVDDVEWIVQAGSER